MTDNLTPSGGHTSEEENMRIMLRALYNRKPEIKQKPVVKAPKSYGLRPEDENGNPFKTRKQYERFKFKSESKEVA